MRRLVVNVALAFGITLSASSIVAAQLLPSPMPNPHRRDPLLKREFQGLTFGQPAAASTPVKIWNERPVAPLNTLGAPLPNVTAAPEPHGTAVVPCMTRTMPVDPSHKSNMPVVSVDERIDPKFVVKAPPCVPRK